MDKEELRRRVSAGLPAELVSEARGPRPDVDRRAYHYLLTRCKLIKSAYKNTEKPRTAQKRKVRLLHVCENQVLDSTIQYLEAALESPDLKPVEKTLE